MLFLIRNTNNMKLKNQLIFHQNLHLVINIQNVVKIINYQKSANAADGTKINFEGYEQKQDKSVNQDLDQMESCGKAIMAQSNIIKGNFISRGQFPW